MFDVGIVIPSVINIIVVMCDLVFVAFIALVVNSMSTFELEFEGVTINLMQESFTWIIIVSLGLASFMPVFNIIMLIVFINYFYRIFLSKKK